MENSEIVVWKKAGNQLSIQAEVKRSHTSGRQILKTLFFLFTFTLALAFIYQNLSVSDHYLSPCKDGLRPSPLDNQGSTGG
jgi:hypothetical protein